MGRQHFGDYIDIVLKSLRIFLKYSCFRPLPQQRKFVFETYNKNLDAYHLHSVKGNNWIHWFCLPLMRICGFKNNSIYQSRFDIMKHTKIYLLSITTIIAELLRLCFYPLDQSHAYLALSPILVLWFDHEETNKLGVIKT